MERRLQDKLSKCAPRIGSSVAKLKGQRAADLSPTKPNANPPAPVKRRAGILEGAAQGEQVTDPSPLCCSHTQTHDRMPLGERGNDTPVPAPPTNPRAMEAP